MKEIKLEPDIILDCEDLSKFRWEMRDMVFSIEKMEMYILSFAEKRYFTNTLNALSYAVKMHSGQYRKGRDLIPYIIHPLTIARHAIAMGLHEDCLIAAILLHDVCEDCRDEKGERIAPEALPVEDEVREAVKLVTKPEHMYENWAQDYYARISTNRIATMVKILDRCNNISTMAAGFKNGKIEKYIIATEKYLIPLLEMAENRYHDKYCDALFLIKYQMLSTIETVKRLLQEARVGEVLRD